MISPVITKITGNDFRVSDIFDLDEYIEVSKNSGSLHNQLETENENQIKDIYKTSLKGDLKQKVESRGYVVEKLEIDVENNEQYTLNRIDLTITKRKK